MYKPRRSRFAVLGNKLVFLCTCVATVSYKLLEMDPKWSPPPPLIELSSLQGSLTHLGAPEGI